MKTKNFIWSLMASAVALGGLSACSADEPVGTGTSNTPGKDGVYMTLTVTLPDNSGDTKSTTVTPGQSNDGIEVGTSEENHVGNVLVVLATYQDNKFVAGGTVLNFAGIPNTTSSKAVYKLEKTTLADYYSKKELFDKDNPYVNIYVFCNPTTALVDVIEGATLGDDKWYDAVCTTSSDISSIASTAGDGSFLMSNVTVARRQIPADVDDWDAYKTESTAFDFSGINAAGLESEVDNSSMNGRGAIRVQRAVARFDFKDGSPAGTDANTYDVVKDANGNTLIQVELNQISLANMSRSFYYLPRVSDNGQLAGSVLCGQETPINYLVGPNASTFSGSVTSNFSTYFLYPFFDNNGENYGTWNTSSISAILSGRDDNYTGPDHSDNLYTPGTYKFWRYVTENVIPAPTESQRNGVTTGVIFRAKLKATKYALENGDKYTKMMAEALNGTGITGESDKDPILYSFNNSLYFTWDNVVVAALSASVKMQNNIPVHETLTENGEIKKRTLVEVNRSEPLYVAVFGKGGIPKEAWALWGNGEELYEDTMAPDATCANARYTAWKSNTNTYDNFRDLVVSEGFTLYQSANGGVDGKGYFCYYFYWNRHNDNNKPGEMGPMEFATVRNNVYKLAVTNIKQLGHPRIPMNDPDKPTPGTPDESDDIYMTVTCEVVPWVVRINNIEF